MPMTRFPGRPPGSRQHPSFPQQQQPQQQHEDDAASHLFPSQFYKFCILKFLTLKGATTDSNRSSDGNIGFGSDVCAHNPTCCDPTGLPTYMYSKNDIRYYFGPVHLLTVTQYRSPVFANGKDSNASVSAAYVSADKTVCDGFSTGIGFGHSFVKEGFS